MNTKLSPRKFVSVWLSTEPGADSRRRHFEGAPDFRGTIDQAAKFASEWAKKCGIGAYVWSKVEGLPAYYTKSFGHGLTALQEAELDLRMQSL